MHKRSMMYRCGSRDVGAAVFKQMDFYRQLADLALQRCAISIPRKLSCSSEA
jgi:hypothetical protein